MRTLIMCSIPFVNLTNQSYRSTILSFQAAMLLLTYSISWISTHMLGSRVCDSLSIGSKRSSLTFRTLCRPFVSSLQHSSPMPKASYFIFQLTRVELSHLRAKLCLFSTTSHGTLSAEAAPLLYHSHLLILIATNLAHRES